ncbi:unnamed protein product [Ambrosiozyma monospora]|uniref:Unnamed protein product n=1 Tax=Ambrosiozyma monospora TaxID=43982 RepID=A0ACB5STQ3_AMBMO|nr:unnamed protein product [Ambrosiozyma monospora]
MQYRYSTVLGALSLASQAYAAYVPSEPWSTLTPDASISGAATDYSATFGIQINPISATSTSKGKRDVVTQIGDGQIQATTETKSTAPVVTQIGDGQIQATTKTQSTAPVVTQIGDGQIQATTFTHSSAPVVTQIGDGQIQATTSTPSKASNSHSTSTNTVSGATQISDGQVQQGTSSAAPETSSTASSGPKTVVVSCKSDGALSMQLKGGILTDDQGRIGSIVANRQFQFDGPPPQAGAIYAAGWSITDDGLLAIGNTTIFYQCLSGNFYNLYDETLGIHCQPVHLDIVDLVSC